MLYWQKCPSCGHLSTPDCEGHMCHACSKATYISYEEYKTPLPTTTNVPLVHQDFCLDWTEEQKQIISSMFSAADEVMMQCEQTQSIREWNAMHDVRERLNVMLLAMFFKDEFGEQ